MTNTNNETNRHRVIMPITQPITAEQFLEQEREKLKEADPFHEKTLLQVIQDRVAKGEIKYQQLSQSYPQYKSIFKEYRDNPEKQDFILKFINTVSSPLLRRPLNPHQRLFVKLINMIPIRTPEIIQLRCSDFEVKGDYCLVADKYLLFIPLFTEVKAIIKDNSLFMSHLLNKSYNLYSLKRTTASWINNRLLKRLGYYGIAQNEFRVRLLFYMIFLGMGEIGEAMALMRTTENFKRYLREIRELR